jgi:hypothetical protein
MIDKSISLPATSSTTQPVIAASAARVTTQEEVKKARGRQSKPKKLHGNHELAETSIPSVPPCSSTPIAAVDPDILEGPLIKIGDEFVKRRFGIPKGKRAKSTDSPVLSTARRTIPRFIGGKPSGDVKEEISKVTEGIQDKFRIVGAMVDTHALERWGLSVQMRWKLSQSLYADLEVDKLSPLEKLALLKMVSTECDDLEKIIRHGANPLQDIEGTLAKVDATLQGNASELANRLKNTTPQGREIARRLAYKAQQLSKQVSAASELAAI